MELLDPCWSLEGKMSDRFRHVYDAYNFGALQESHPLQSAMLRDALCSNSDDRRTIEAGYVNFCSNLVPSINFSLTPKRKLDDCLSSGEAKKNILSLGDVLDFADDLSMTTIVAIKKRPPEAAPAPPPVRPSVSSSNVVVIEDQRPPSADATKRGPFTTAKQQYISEASQLVFDAVASYF